MNWLGSLISQRLVIPVSENSRNSSRQAEKTSGEETGKGVRQPDGCKSIGRNKGVEEGVAIEWFVGRKIHPARVCVVVVGNRCGSSGWRSPLLGQL